VAVRVDADDPGPRRRRRLGVTAAANLHAVAIRIHDVPRAALFEVAKAAKRIAAEEGAAAGGPLQGKKKRAMRLKAFDDIRDTATGATCRIQGVNPAGWVWVTDGTKPHAIRRRKKGPMRKMTVQHPGTASRGGWKLVEKRVIAVVVPAFDGEVSRAVS
jgi:hypothetical protein